ncbi:YchJ family protein [Ponticaulis koreensis]|uniref:YchJ family protein n=1 Tax=Ponticaulis koreensis TaxID=1123045 RepID=UPI0003B67EFE|nr:YchJ family protein [Ponticaulis koreensis]
MTCPCGTGRDYSDCCGRFHADLAVPETAEELMRSRYCAYANQKIEYLVATHDPDRLDEFDRLQAGKWARDAEFTRLDILSTVRGKAGDETGMVEFIAWFLLEGDLTCHHEKSSFRRLDGKWVYTDGMSKPAASMFALLGRNDACPCASGKKFKKCHGAG